MRRCRYPRGIPSVILMLSAATLLVILMAGKREPFDYSYNRDIGTVCISETGATQSPGETSRRCHIEADGVAEYVVDRPGRGNAIKFKSYADALASKADSEGVIMLSAFDYGYLDQAINFYETSILPLKLDNYLFVCSDRKAYSVIHELGIDSILYMEDIATGDKASIYGSSAFNKKTHMKTAIILDALQLNYTVLIADVDIVFFKNPFKYMPCRDCDIQIQNDTTEGNSGFYLARPTQAAIDLHRTALHLAKTNKGMSNQKTIDRTMERMVKANTLVQKTLDISLFPCGYYYYEEAQRMFAGDSPCQKCVLVHNNWIVGNPAKIYRFKEHLHWAVDKNRYYSDRSRKYLLYENPIRFGKSSLPQEQRSLESALAIGHVLNRTVILPTFHCEGCPRGACKNKAQLCALNAHFRVSTLDECFRDSYREHVFLQHNKVPGSVKTSQSGEILIQTSIVQTHLTELGQLITDTFTPRDPSKGADSDEILAWFGKPPYSTYFVLKFSCLYDAFSHFVDTNQDMIFREKLSNGIKRAEYRQY